MVTVSSTPRLPSNLVRIGLLLSRSTPSDSTTSRGAGIGIMGAAEQDRSHVACQSCTCGILSSRMSWPLSCARTTHYSAFPMHTAASQYLGINELILARTWRAATARRNACTRSGVPRTQRERRDTSWFCARVLLSFPRGIRYAEQYRKADPLSASYMASRTASTLASPHQELGYGVVVAEDTVSEHYREEVGPFGSICRYQARLQIVSTNTRIQNS